MSNRRQNADTLQVRTRGCLRIYGQARPLEFQAVFDRTLQQSDACRSDAGACRAVHAPSESFPLRSEEGHPSFETGIQESLGRKNY